MIGAGGAAYVYRFKDQTWIEEQKLLVASAGDVFGSRVALSGDMAVIGAGGDDDNGTDSGSAYIYRFNDYFWFQDKELLPPDGAAGDLFGHSVAISGNVAVVGAMWDDDNGSDSGSAYVFRRKEHNWIQEQKILASDGSTNDHFGVSVSVSGDLIVIGASFDDDNNDSGSAYVYRFNGTTWIEEQKLLPADDHANRFGGSVSLSGDAVLIGDAFNGETGFLAGAAYVFRDDGTSWIEEQKLLASDRKIEDYFGSSVSLSGDAALIGAPRTDKIGVPHGVAYVFRFDGITWIEEQQLLPAGDGAGGVSLSGDTAVLGASLDDDHGIDAGSAYVYRYNGTTWIEDQELHASDGAAGDEFGSSVSVSGDTALVGAPLDDDAGADSGSAYLLAFELCEPCPADVNDDTVVGPADLAELLVSWGLCDDCSADIDPPGGDGLVWGLDLGVLLAGWGQCPQ